MGWGLRRPCNPVCSRRFPADFTGVSQKHDRCNRKTLPETELVARYNQRRPHASLGPGDYLAFLAFSYSVLLCLHVNRREVERVDFWVERNGKISTRIGRLHAQIPKHLTELGVPELAALVGEFLPVAKTRIPAQAADMLCWHERNFYAGTLDPEGQRRRKRMVAKREGHRNDVGAIMFDDFAERLRQKFPRPRLKAV
jgi:hypothetical protein